MNLVVGVLLMWLGSALLFVATHATGAASPWQVYQKLLGIVGGQSG